MAMNETWDPNTNRLVVTDRPLDLGSYPWPWGEPTNKARCPDCGERWIFHRSTVEGFNESLPSIAETSVKLARLIYAKVREL